jgi:hypothetical protein
MRICRPSNYSYSSKAESERIDLGFAPRDRRIIDKEELAQDKIQLLVKDRHISLNAQKDDKLEQT